MRSGVSRPAAKLDDAAHLTAQGRGRVAVLERELASLAVRLNGAPRGAAGRHPDVLTAEAELARVRPGQTVEIRIDTYGRRRWQGRVESISPATGSQFALLPPQNASGHWVKVVQRVPVRITLYPGDDDPPLRIGMSANARIDTGPLELPTVRTAHSDP